MYFLPSYCVGSTNCAGSCNKIVTWNDSLSMQAERKVVCQWTSPCKMWRSLILLREPWSIAWRAPGAQQRKPQSYSLASKTSCFQWLLIFMRTCMFVMLVLLIRVAWCCRGQADNFIMVITSSYMESKVEWEDAKWFSSIILFICTVLSHMQDFREL